MIRIEFASSIQRYVPMEPLECKAATLENILKNAFERQPALRGYVLDDQGAVRKHITIFVNDRAIRDRAKLTDELKNGDSVYVMQALSGG